MKKKYTKKSRKHFIKKSRKNLRKKSRKNFRKKTNKLKKIKGGMGKKIQPTNEGQVNPNQFAKVYERLASNSEERKQLEALELEALTNNSVAAVAARNAKDYLKEAEAKASRGRTASYSATKDMLPGYPWNTLRLNREAVKGTKYEKNTDSLMKRADWFAQDAAYNLNSLKNAENMEDAEKAVKKVAKAASSAKNMENEARVKSRLARMAGNEAIEMAINEGEQRGQEVVKKGSTINVDDKMERWKPIIHHDDFEEFKERFKQYLEENPEIKYVGLQYRPAAYTTNFGSYADSGEAFESSGTYLLWPNMGEDERYPITIGIRRKHRWER